MMSSVDMTSGSAGASSTPRTASSNPPPHHPQYQHPQSRYATMSGPPARTGSPAPHPPAAYHQSHAPAAPPRAEAGRLMSEQVVLELLNKVTELVLQSRVHLQSEPGHHATSSARRGRFNLDIEEIPHIRESMGAWREDVHTPLTVDIYWDGDGEQRVLLERWSLVYTNGLSAANAGDQFDAFNFNSRRHSSNSVSSSIKSYAAAGHSRPVLDVLKDVVKKFSVLLRAVHSFMRLLPAHRFFRQSYPSTLSYEIHSCDESQLASGFEMGIATSQYSFQPINTPFGFVKLSTLYRRDCSPLERRRKRVSKEIFEQNLIIQDYVPASPELTAASASRQSPSLSASPSTHAVRMMPPMALSPRGKPKDGYEDDDLDARRRRSSPEMVADDSHGSPRRVKSRPQQIQSPPQNISQPMAIPQQVKTPALAPHTYDDHLAVATHTTSTLDGVTSNKPIHQHAHSYGEPGRLRTVATNPNVTPAPYGYGNVAVERAQTPPVGFLGSSSGGFSGGGGGSYQDPNISSPHPLSTPPRHPHSILTPRLSGGGRTSFVSSMTSSAKKSSNEYAYRASLENFSLDTSGPSPHQSPSPSPSAALASPSTEANSRAQTFSFGSRRSVDSASSDRSLTPELPPSRAPASGSPLLTPPFMADSPPTHSTQSAQDQQSTAALVLRRQSLEQSPSLTGTPVFTSSPPFQANPTELLSTSPGYSHSKHFQSLRRGGPPTFLSTDASFGRGSVTGTSAPSGHAFAGFTTTPSSSGGQLSLSKGPGESSARTFSNTLQDNSGGIWGISPDSPDTFAFSIGASTRRRFFSSTGDDNGSSLSPGNRPSSGDREDEGIDSEMMLMPFALHGDAENLSTTTTVTATSSASDQGQPSSAFGFADDSRGGMGMAWDTASVGSFLQQLKNAPRLQTFERNDEEAGEPHATSSSHSATARSTETTTTTSAFFDDELESFRNLRNEFTNAI